MNILYLLNPKESVAYIHEDNTLRQGLEKMDAHGYAAIPVLTKSGKYAGTVTEGDFLWFMVKHGGLDAKDLEQYSVKDIIRKGWNGAVRVSETMEDLMRRVMDQNFVPVIDDRGFFVGIVTRKDVIKNYEKILADKEKRQQKKICVENKMIV